MFSRMAGLSLVVVLALGTFARAESPTELTLKTPLKLVDDGNTADSWFIGGDVSYIFYNEFKFSPDFQNPTNGVNSPLSLTFGSSSASGTEYGAVFGHTSSDGNIFSVSVLHADDINGSGTVSNGGPDADFNWSMERWDVLAGFSFPLRESSPDSTIYWNLGFLYSNQTMNLTGVAITGTASETLQWYGLTTGFGFSTPLGQSSSPVSLFANGGIFLGGLSAGGVSLTAVGQDVSSSGSNSFAYGFNGSIGLKFDFNSSLGGQVGYRINYLTETNNNAQDFIQSAFAQLVLRF